MTDTKNRSLELVAELVQRGVLDRRRLFQTAAAMGISLTGVAAVADPRSVAAAAAAQESDLKLATISEQQLATFTKNFNPFAPDNTSRWPTQAGMYEPLAIHSMMEGIVEPWLATAWEYSDDLLTLTWTLQEGVTWSDGTPFTSADVKYTYDLLLANEALTGTGAIRSALPLLASVEAPDDLTVVMTFNEVNTLTLYDFAEQMIVPKHIWEAVEDPVTFLNEEPVGTGPFTEIGIFEAQYWELHKNPNYWQEGKPFIDGFRFPSFPTNDAANLATINGEVDWAGNFVPDVENTFVAQDPEHFHYWFPQGGDMHHLSLNTTVPPFDNVEVRKAISMAIDRPQIVTVALYDYTTPADSSGLTSGYPGFKTMDASTEGTWVIRDVDAANAALDAAGFTLDGDVRVGPDGPLEFEINMPTGWSDWVSAGQIISKNLEDIGIRATVATLDVSAWFDAVQKGEYTMSIAFSGQGPTPFNYYRNMMSSTTLFPVGEPAQNNWHRFSLPEADELLTQMGQTADVEEQKAIVAQLQELFNQNAPMVPLHGAPQWGEFVTLRFEGFPSEENPYASLPTWDTPERLVVMTTITPIEGA